MEEKDENEEVIKEQLRKRGAYEVLIEVAEWMHEELAPHHERMGSVYAATVRAKSLDLADLARSLLI